MEIQSPGPEFASTRWQRKLCLVGLSALSAALDFAQPPRQKNKTTYLLPRADMYPIGRHGEVRIGQWSTVNFVGTSTREIQKQSTHCECKQEDQYTTIPVAQQLCDDRDPCCRIHAIRGHRDAAGISRGQGRKHQPGAHNGRCWGNKPAVNGQGQQDDNNLGGHSNEAPGDHHRTEPEQPGKGIPSPHATKQPRVATLAKPANATTPSSGGLAEQENTTTPSSGGRIGMDSQFQPQHMDHSTTIKKTIPSNEPAID